MYICGSLQYYYYHMTQGVEEFWADLKIWVDVRFGPKTAILRKKLSHFCENAQESIRIVC